jgi:hypothetical protein
MPKGNNDFDGGWSENPSIKWDYGAVSDGGADDGRLHHDDGSVHGNVGSVDAAHAVDRAHGGYNKSSGFSQPSDRDFGPADSWAGASHLDDKAGQTPLWNSESEAKSSHADAWTDMPLNPSPSRIKKVSAFETYTEKDGEGRWYGSPDGERQE